jgi:hypothetical protein
MYVDKKTKKRRNSRVKRGYIGKYKKLRFFKNIVRNIKIIKILFNKYFYKNTFIKIKMILKINIILLKCIFEIKSYKIYNDIFNLHLKNKN